MIIYLEQTLKKKNMTVNSVIQFTSLFRYIPVGLSSGIAGIMEKMLMFSWCHNKTHYLELNFNKKSFMNDGDAKTSDYKPVIMAILVTIMMIENFVMIMNITLK